MNLDEYRKHFQQRWRHTLSAPCVMVAAEKHDERHFYITGLEDLERVALKLITERVKNGWIGAYRNAVKPPVPKDVVLEWPKSEMRQMGLDQWDLYERRVKEDDTRRRQVDLAKQAIDEQNGTLALIVLTERCDHEYEHWSLTPFEKVEAAHDSDP